MDFRETTVLFLENLSVSSKEIYQIKIDYFYNFLTEEKGINNKSFSSYLEGMKIDEIIEAINYYIVKNDISSESIAFHYSSIIKRYFDFLYSRGIKNDELIKSFGIASDRKESYQKIIHTYINNDSRLDKVEKKLGISEDEFNILVSECDQNIKEVIDTGKILDFNVYPIEYNDLMTSIMIKLILFTGAPYRTLRKIEKNHICMLPCKITINDFTVHLPTNLASQFVEYLNVRKLLPENSLYLFVDEFGGELSEQTSRVADTIKAIIGRSDINGLVKFTIIKMIERGINQSIIQDFTNIGSTVYMDCQEIVNSKKENTSSRYLDSKLRSMSVFDDL